MKSDVDVVNAIQLWESLANVSYKIQNTALSKASFRYIIIKFLKELRSAIDNDKLPICRSEFSVIYHDYGQSPAFLVINGNICNQEVSDTQYPVDIENSYIKRIAEKSVKDPYYFKTEEECSNAGFIGYKSILLDPMTLNKNKNIGMFLLHSKSQENAYDCIQSPLNALSDQLAFYMEKQILLNVAQIGFRKYITNCYEKNTAVKLILYQ